MQHVFAKQDHTPQGPKSTETSRQPPRPGLSERQSKEAYGVRAPDPQQAQPYDRERLIKDDTLHNSRQPPKAYDATTDQAYQHTRRPVRFSPRGKTACPQATAEEPLREPKGEMPTYPGRHDKRYSCPGQGESLPFNGILCHCRPEAYKPGPWSVCHGILMPVSLKLWPCYSIKGACRIGRCRYVLSLLTSLWEFSRKNCSTSIRSSMTLVKG
jgi:hypothetical protein